MEISKKHKKELKEIGVILLIAFSISFAFATINYIYVDYQNYTDSVEYWYQYKPIPIIQLIQVGVTWFLVLTIIFLLVNMFGLKKVFVKEA